MKDVYLRSYPYEEKKHRILGVIPCTPNDSLRDTMLLLYNNLAWVYEITSPNLDVLRCFFRKGKGILIKSQNRLHLGNHSTHWSIDSLASNWFLRLHFKYTINADRSDFQFSIKIFVSIFNASVGLVLANKLRHLAYIAPICILYSHSHDWFI